VFEPAPRLQLLDAVGETIVHHWEKGDKTSDAVLNACRALRYADEVVWSSKLSAGVWAIERQYEPRLVAQALAVRHSPDQFAVDDLDGFLQRTRFAVQLIADFVRKNEEPCATPAHLQ
jgi:hypothetical protein